MSLNYIWTHYPLSSRVIVAIITPGIIAAIAAYAYLLQSLPNNSGEIEVSTIKASVTISRDQYSIPTIEAGNDLDAFFAMGYAHAQDRLWQMEVNRRTTAGRLSEIIGAAAIGADRFARIMGFYRDTEKTWQQLSAEEKTILQAYVDGINQWLDEEHVLPFEFIYFSYTPEKWTVKDSLAWLHSIAWSMSGNWQAEQARARTIRMFGATKAAELLPLQQSDEQSIVANDANVEHMSESLVKAHEDFTSILNLQGPYVGSNNWVVSGKHTQSGKPLLANDPHLQNSIPALWYLARIKGDKIDAQGATFPGLPFVILGNNKNIAWGVTNMQADVQDIFIERVDPLNPNNYIVNDKTHTMETLIEKISVRPDKFKDPVDPIQMTVRKTIHGPVVSDIFNAPPEVAYSLKWTGTDGLGGTFSSLYKINYAQNWESFKDALRSFISPAQNYVYADNAGNIGYFGAGKIPIRSNGDGSKPALGWTNSNQWESWIPFEELPQQYNPESGFIVTANNKIVGDNYPHYITSDWSPSYRAKRISELLQQASEKKKLTKEDMIAIQSDVFDLHSQKVLPFLDILKPQNEKLVKATEYLKDWDGSYNVDGIAPTIYQSWLENFTRLILEDDVKNSEMQDLAYRYNPLFLNNMIAKPDSSWCDHKITQDITETCEAIANIAFEHAVTYLSTIGGNDIEDWQWGKIHQAHYGHYPFSESKYMLSRPASQDYLLRYIFHRSIASPGSQNSVNVAPTAFSNKNSPFAQLWGASYRQISDLENLDNSLFSLPTGQSGNILSKHYDDMLEMHRDVKFLTMNASSNELKLVPKAQ